MFNKKNLLFIAYLIYVLTIFAEASDCNPHDFQCQNGQCINAEFACDGNKDCNDGSDELIDHCFKLDCPEYSFRCAYGACIEANMKCDGKIDCADGSDEHTLLCWNATDFDGYFKKIQGNCEEFSMQCPNETNHCVSFENICDGEAHCLNEADESPELCTGIQCPKYAYRCGTGACINRDLVCNHVADCTDKSDEIKEICIEKEAEKQKERAHQNCYKGEKCKVNEASAVVIVQPDEKYDSNGKRVPTSSGTASTTASPESSPTTSDWFVVPHGSTPHQYRQCQIPKHRAELHALDYLKRHKYAPGQHVSTQTMILFQCATQHKLIGHEFNTCFDGVWLTQVPYCEPQCPAQFVSRGISTIQSCSYKDQYANCKEPARPGTIVQYKCAPQYEPADNAITECLQESTCGDDGKWSSVAPRCLPTCGLLKNTYAEHRPWIVSIYQRYIEPKYEMKCYGTIISPKIVLSVGSCFDNDEESENHNPLDYNIAEGRHHMSYNQFDGHGLRLHNVSQILLEGQKEIARVNYELALFIIVNYFQFSTSLSPICFDVNHSNKEALILQQDIIADKGEIVEIPKTIGDNKLQRSFLTSIVYTFYEKRNKTDVLDVSKFRNFINAQIKRYEFIL